MEKIDFIKYLLSNWTIVLSASILLVAVFRFGQMLVGIMNDRAFYLNHDFEVQVYQIGDLVMSRNDVDEIVSEGRDNIPSALIWVVSDFEGGIYTLVNFSFRRYLKKSTNNQLTLLSKRKDS
jgi:hypothetical protein